MTEQLHEISHLIEPSIIWNHFCRGMLFTKIIHEHCCHETFGHSRNDFCYRRLRPINSLGCSIYTPEKYKHRNVLLMKHFLSEFLNLKFLYLSLERFLPKDISGTF